MHNDLPFQLIDILLNCNTKITCPCVHVHKEMHPTTLIFKIQFYMPQHERFSSLVLQNPAAQRREQCTLYMVLYVKPMRHFTLGRN